MTLPSPIFLIRKVIAALYPPRCLCCGKLLSGESPLCPACFDLWQTERLCVSSPREDGILHLSVYSKGSSVTRRLVLLAKNSNERRLYRFLAGELAKLLSQNDISADFIVNVPRSPAAVRNTGVDQSSLLARALAKATGIRYLNALRHKRKARAQKTLDAAQRALNAASAYRLARKAEKSLAGCTVILIDDVATTGATFSACEKLLIYAGAVRVIKIAVASTERTGQKQPQPPSVPSE